MNKAKILRYIYDDFLFVDDILINHPQGQYSWAMGVIAFSTIIEAVMKKDLPSWFLLEELGPDLQGPELPVSFVLNYYKYLKHLGCQRVVVVSNLPILFRTSTLNVIRQSGIQLDVMPDEKSAISWIQYLKQCREVPLITTYSYPTY